MPLRRIILRAPALALLLVLALAPAAGGPRAYAAHAHSPGVDALVTELSSSTGTLDAQLVEIGRLGAVTPPDAFATARATMQAAAAQEHFRNTVRTEQKSLYVLAGDPTMAARVEARLGSRAPRGMPSALTALQALFALAGDPAPAPEYEFPYNAALPLPVLQSYYQGAAQAEGLDWKYLAAINFLESTFGRNPNDSPAGAQGPMQFIPSTWGQYGAGGNIRDPHDAIYTAARYLRAMGAPADYQQAIRRYNNDGNYVTAVSDLAAAIGADPLWLQRLYYWNTYG